MKPYVSVLGCVLLSLVATGCGSKKVHITGQLTYGGVPLKGSDREPIRVSFDRQIGDDRKPGGVVVADVDQENGTYKVVVRSGKYRICIAHFANGLTDRYQNAFGEENSPIIRDLENDEELDLDLKDLRK